jgi:hypothetical protein
MLTDPRMLVLALAAESSSVAWGFGQCFEFLPKKVFTFFFLYFFPPLC